MAEPEIRYCTTSDGVSIAYWKTGSGPPLVQMPGEIITLMINVFAGEAQRWRERLAQRNTLVRNDYRGFGQSERSVSDISLDTLVLDLEAVVDQLGEERVALLGFARSGPVAIAYAARHPERVSHLVLYGTSARGETLFADAADPRQQAMERLAEADWETYTEVVAHKTLGWEESALARSYAAGLRENTTRESLHASVEAVRRFDVTALLPAVRSPALVLFRRHVALPPPEESRLLASRIPGARLVVLEGDQLVPYMGDMESVLAAIGDFLAHEEPPRQAAAEPDSPSLRTILFTDLASSTALTQRLGDAQAQELVRAHNSIVREALRSHSGTEIKHTGDGIMASFGSASGALECAVSIQRGAGVGGGPDPRPSTLDPSSIKIGLNAGEPVAEESDLFGTAVQLARRVCDQASGGEILVSDVVRQLAAGKDFLFSDRGVADLKGFDEPVRLFEVRWQEGE